MNYHADKETITEKIMNFRDKSVPYAFLVASGGLDSDYRKLTLVPYNSKTNTKIGSDVLKKAEREFMSWGKRIGIRRFVATTTDKFGTKEQITKILLRVGFEKIGPKSYQLLIGGDR